MLSGMDNNTKIIVGVDAHSHGFAFHVVKEEDGAYLTSGYIARQHKGRSGEEIDDYPAHLAAFIKTCMKHRASLVIEDAHFSKNQRTFRALAAVHAEIDYEIWRQEATYAVDVERVQPSMWQNQLFSYYDLDVNRKRTGETKVLAKLISDTQIRHPIEDTEHAIDAACIAHWKYLCLANEIEV